MKAHINGLEVLLFDGVLNDADRSAIVSLNWCGWLGMVKALEYFEENGEVCPANWQEGARTIKPTPSDSKEFFGAEYGD